MIVSCSSSVCNRYVPPVTGNGEISLLVDYEGAQSQKNYYNMIPTIWRAGCRYDTPMRELVPFGHFEQEIIKNGKPVHEILDWSQSLNIKDGCIRSVCRYEGGINIETLIYVHTRYNLIVINKKFLTPEAVQYSFKYTLAQPGTDNIPPRRMTFSPETDKAEGIIDVEYLIDGQQEYRGRISLFADLPLEPVINSNEFILQGDFSSKEATFYILFSDDFDNKDNIYSNDYQDKSIEIKKIIRSEGFGGLFDQHRKDWADYWNESYVRLPDRKIEESYYSSQYHLRTAATRWSIPIAIADTHWHGKFFGFDEYFSFIGLLSSNHVNLARRVPEFRFAGLKSAIARASRYFEGSNFKTFARYPWETVETGEEASPFGFWHEHVFHMAHIALEAWDYYRFTNDQDFLLKKGYPVIKSCADFFLYMMIYETADGKTIIGKCTDLERLGPAVENAYMTTCSAISALLAAGDSAGILGIDAQAAEKWRDAAYRLKKSLPHDGTKYVPYPGYEQKSVAILSGLFPYPVIDTDDEKQLNAINDFCNTDVSHGNMYPVGNSVCSWYAAWKAIIFARLQEGDKAFDNITQAAGSAGCFSELFEINEPSVTYRPWFSTAEGTYIQGVNEMLVQSSDGQINIAPAVPKEWQDYSFKLRCCGDIVVECRISCGKIEKIELQAGEFHKAGKTVVIIPINICEREKLRNANILSVAEKEGNYVIEIVFDSNRTSIELV